MINTDKYYKLIFQFSFRLVLLAIIILILALFLIGIQVNNLLVLLIFIVLLIFFFFVDIKKIIRTYDLELSETIENISFLKTAISSINLALFVTDGEQLLYYNEATKKIFGKTLKFLETCSVFDLIAEEDREKFQTILSESNGANDVILRINNSFKDIDTTFGNFSVSKQVYAGKDRFTVIAYEISEYHKEKIDNSETISLYESALNNSPDSVAIFNEKGKLFFINDEAQKSNLLGISSANELTFANLIEYNINRSLLNAAFHIALDGETYSNETVILRQKDREQWGRIIFSPLISPNGNKFVQYSVNNVTEYRSYTYGLERQVHIWREAFETSYIGQICWNKNGNFIKANHQFFEMMNLDEEAYEDENLNLNKYFLHKDAALQSIIFYPSDVYKKVAFSKKSIHLGVKKYSEMLLNREKFEIVAQLNILNKNVKPTADKNYSTVWYKCYIYPIWDTNNELLLTICEVVNISDYYSVLDKYIINRTYLEAIANNFYAGIIFIVNADYNIVFLGGEDKVKQNINISGFSEKIYYNLLQQSELNIVLDNVKVAMEGNYSRLSVTVFGNDYDFQFFPIRDSFDGIIKHCIGIAFNISERNKYERQLIFQKNFHEKIFTESAIATIVIDTVGNIINANTKYSELSGQVLSQIINSNIYDKNSWLNKEIIIKNFQTALEGVSTQFEILEEKKFVSLDDYDIEEIFYFNLSCKFYPITNSNNTVNSIVLHLIDISDTRAMIETMKQTQAISDVVTSNYPNGLLIILNTKFNILLIDGKEEIEALQMTNKWVKGRNFNAVESPISGIIAPYFNKVIESRTKVNFDFTVDTALDGKFFYETNIIPIFNYEEKLEYIYICLNNITSRKLLEETILKFNAKLEDEVETRTAQLKETTYDLEVYIAELQVTQNRLVLAQNDLSLMLAKEQELNHIKSQFISLMSHEFRTPLTIIQTSVYLIEAYYEHLNPPEAIAQKFNNNNQKIFEAIDMMTKLIDNVLFLDEIKIHKIALVHIEIMSLLQSNIQDTVIAFKAQQAITVNTNSNLIKMFTDQQLFGQIVKNLLSNAIKYSPKTSQIIIDVIDSDNVLMFSVQDFGHGIADDIIDKVFESFVRSASVTNISGSGLGLSIVKNCVEVLKGEITFETKANQGTKFIVTLPKLDGSDLIIN